jgi:hypothetical protein
MDIRHYVIPLVQEEITSRTQKYKAMWQYEHSQLEGENNEFAEQQSRKLQDTRYCTTRNLSNEYHNKFRRIMTDVIKYENG